MCAADLWHLSWHAPLYLYILHLPFKHNKSINVHKCSHVSVYLNVPGAHLSTADYVSLLYMKFMSCIPVVVNGMDILIKV